MKCVLILLLCLTCVQSVLSCSCFPTHLQTKFCQSKFVVYAVPLAKVEAATQQDDTVYTLLLIRVLKDTSGTLQSLTVVQATTAANGGLCGVFLTLFKPYVLGHGAFQNGQMRLHSCGINKIVKDFSSCELGLLTGYTITGGWFYNRWRFYDCSCTVRYCIGDDCSPSHDECVWNHQQDKKQIGSCQINWYSWKCSWKPC